MAKKARLYAKALVSSLDNVAEKEQKVRVVRFLNLLKKRGELRQLSLILQEFKKFWEQRKGTIAHVVSAENLSLPLASEIKKSLAKQGYQVKEEKDTRVIGGTAVFLSNEYLFDNTVKGKLEKLKAALKL